MTQRTLDGRADCKKVKGSVTIKMSDGFKEKHPEICDAIKECHEKYPCIKMRINNKVLETKKVDWKEV